MYTYLVTAAQRVTFIFRQVAGAWSYVVVIWQRIFARSLENFPVDVNGHDEDGSATA